MFLLTIIMPSAQSEDLATICKEISIPVFGGTRIPFCNVAATLRGFATLQKIYTYLTITNVDMYTIF
jgi:hypothetical protein